jgi:hypothetical protein
MKKLFALLSLSLITLSCSAETLYPSAYIICQNHTCGHFDSSLFTIKGDPQNGRYPFKHGDAYLIDDNGNYRLEFKYGMPDQPAVYLISKQTLAPGIQWVQYSNGHLVCAYREQKPIHCPFSL